MRAAFEWIGKQTIKMQLKQLLRKGETGVVKGSIYTKLVRNTLLR